MSPVNNLVDGSSKDHSPNKHYKIGFKLSGVQLNVESKSYLPWFCFTMLCDWKKNMSLSPPISIKTKTNCDLLECIFVHLTIVAKCFMIIALLPSVVTGHSDNKA